MRMRIGPIELQTQTKFSVLFAQCFLSERERSPLKERNSNKYGNSPGKQATHGSPGKNLASPNKRDVPITLSPAKTKQVRESESGNVNSLTGLVW